MKVRGAVRAWSKERAWLILAVVSIMVYGGYEAARAAVASRTVVVAHYGSLVWVEEKLFGAPIYYYASLHANPFLDAVSSVIYSLHPAYFLAFLVYLAARRQRDFASALIAFTASSVVAIVVYSLYPTAPPWIALPFVERRPDYIVRAFSGLFGSHVDPNPYAAFPSMHVCIATLFAIYLYRATGRRLAHLWPLAMALATMYTGNHYLVDVLAGAMLAAASARIGDAAAERIVAGLSL